jgi:hypothetical protein
MESRMNPEIKELTRIIQNNTDIQIRYGLVEVFPILNRDFPAGLLRGEGPAMRLLMLHG